MVGINLIRCVGSKDLCPFYRLFLHSVNNFLLLYGSFSISWSPVCRSLAFSFKQLESYSGSVSLCPIFVCFPYFFSLTVSEFQISHSGLWFIWSWFLCMVRGIQIHPSCVVIQVVLNHLLERLPFLHWVLLTPSYQMRKTPHSCIYLVFSCYFLIKCHLVILR